MVCREVLSSCLFWAGSVALSATTVSMSSDLVPLGIASQNMVPTQPALDARPFLQSVVSYKESHPGIVDLPTLNTGSNCYGRTGGHGDPRRRDGSPRWGSIKR